MDQNGNTPRSQDSGPLEMDDFDIPVTEVEDELASPIETLAATEPSEQTGAVATETAPPESENSDASPAVLGSVLEYLHKAGTSGEMDANLPSGMSAVHSAADQAQPAAEVVEILQPGLAKSAPVQPQGLLAGLQQRLDSAWLDPETYKGLAYVLQIAAQMQVEFVQRRLRGEFEVDEWGYDPEIADYFALVAGLFYSKYWRVEISGLERIPDEGRALMVANHSGVLPMDGAMIAYGVREHHRSQRLVRALVANLFPTLPFMSTLLNRTGQVLAHPDNGRRLLEADELVLVFPEGYKGVGKLFRDRYKLARFGRGGFVKMAVESRAPIIPVAVVGAEETYPMLMNFKPVARLLGFPFFPITPTFPMLGLFGVLPLPSKWYIDIGEPIDAHLSQPELASNPAFISDVTDQVRNQVQNMIDIRLEMRKSVFFG